MGNSEWPKVQMKKLLIILFLFALTNCIPVKVNRSYNAGSTKRYNEEQLIIMEKLYLQGANSYKQRDFKGAATFWDNILGMNPYYKKAGIFYDDAFNKYDGYQKNYYRAMDEFNKTDFRKAAEYFQKALFINLNHEKALYYLNLCYEKLGMKIFIKDKNSEKGSDIKDVQIALNDELTLYVIGYDNENNLLGPVNVSWEQTGTLDSLRFAPDLMPVNEEILRLATTNALTNSRSNKIKFIPTTLNTEGTIIAYTLYSGKTNKCETGKITVVFNKK